MNLADVSHYFTEAQDHESQSKTNMFILQLYLHFTEEVHLTRISS